MFYGRRKHKSAVLYPLVCEFFHFIETPKKIAYFEKTLKNDSLESDELLELKLSLLPNLLSVLDDDKKREIHKNIFSVVFASASKNQENVLLEVEEVL